MSEFTIDLEWLRGDAPFVNREYAKEHTVRFAGGQDIRNSAAADYGGDAAAANPEELLLAALSSCHMLTFLAVCSVRGHIVERYVDHAGCTLGKNADGKMAITEATLSPEVSFSANPPDAAQLEQLHARAHANCFIAQSLRTKVRVAGLNH
jgi:organic hydroperoxide reductase OsmC/OhrA